MDFGPVGWNDFYTFDASDLDVSLKQLREMLAAMKLREEGSVEEKAKKELWPMTALRYLTAECYYGGRVTDVRDRRLLLTLLQHFYNGSVADEKGFNFSDHLAVPAEVSRSHCLAAIDEMPVVTPPSYLGLNDNSAVTKNARASQQVLNGVIVAQNNIVPVTELDEETEDNKHGALLVKVKQDMIDKIPANFDLVAVERDFAVSYTDSLNQILKLELGRYNLLLDEIRLTLGQVEQALSGKIVMSPEVEEVFGAILQNQIPSPWLRACYPSLRPLRGFLRDLRQRCTFFSDWIGAKLAPDSFWLSGFFFPHSFLTSIRQNFARSRPEPTTVDQVSLRGCF